MKKEIITEINFPGIKTSYVILVNYSASLDAVKHLITTGRKRIAMITYDSGLVHLQERTNGYIAALEPTAGSQASKQALGPSFSSQRIARPWCESCLYLFTTLCAP